MGQYSRRFRIFVSSTFTDFISERNALQEYVFPRLRDLARRYGCSFQAIDLRWGVSDKAALDQQTMNICFAEIERCRKVNSVPNFIVLIGNRFGSCQLPYSIPADEFVKVTSLMTGAEQELLHWNDLKSGRQDWYRRDDNAIPAEYVLQSRRGTPLEGYTEWNEIVQRPLLAALTTAAQKAKTDERSLIKYTFSATWQEIAKGIFNIDDAEQYTLGFIRSIKNLDALRVDLSADIRKRADGSKAGDFIDIHADKTIDEDAARQLQALILRLHHHLASNIFEYENVEWTIEGLTKSHIGALPPTLDECLKLNENPGNMETLCEDAWRGISNTMLSEITKLEAVDDLAREIESHRKFGEDRATKAFVGRVELLERIAAFLKRDGLQYPLILWGASGSGKSAIMAKAIQELRDSKSDAKVVFRYIGATPSSLDIRLILIGLCKEIIRDYDLSIDVSSMAFEDVVTSFLRCLAQVEKSSKKLIIFLDALDQLSEKYEARKLAWLPSQGFTNVRIIISTLPDKKYSCYQSLAERVPAAEAIEVPQMPVNDGAILLDRWLKVAGRTLTASQKKSILQSFASNGLPLFIELVFQEGRHWHSYDELAEASGNDSDSNPSVIDAIHGLFDRLSEESNHGPVLTKYALSYLAASRYGISEDEILEILSADQDVMNDYQQRRSQFSPDIKGLPPIVWSRLYFDLEPYLNEQMADGVMLLGFYHRELKDVAEQDYLTTEVKAAIHTRLVAYWSKSGENHPRKLSELPYHLSQLKQWEKLSQLLCQPDFFIASYQRDKFDVLYFWSLIEANSDKWRFEAYQDIIRSPHSYSADLMEPLTEMLQKSFNPKSETEMNMVMDLRKYLVSEYRKIENHAKLIDSLNQFAEFLVGKDGYFNQGMEMAREAEELSQQHSDWMGEQRAIGNQASLLGTTILKYQSVYLGIAYGLIEPDSRFPGELDVHRIAEESRRLARKREVICNRMNYAKGLQESLGFQAFVLSGLGYLHAAMQLLKKQYESAKLADNPEVMAQACRDMAEICRKYRQIDEAIDYIQEARMLTQKYSLRSYEFQIEQILESLVRIPRYESKIKEVDFSGENQLDWSGMSEKDILNHLSHYSDPNTRDKYGQTALLTAVERDSMYLVTELMKRFADFNARDAKGQSALGIAIRNNHSQIIQVLIEKGAKE